MKRKPNNSSSLRAKLESLKTIRLSEEDRNALKSRLLSYADIHTAPERPTRVRSPFTYTSLVMSSRVVFSGTLALVLLIGTTGVSLAAENTLPGQPLYAVKVNVAEPAVSAIISVTGGKAAEAKWQNALAERRLQEAAMLAARNQLASSTQDFLAQQVAEHVSASQEDSIALADAGATTTASETNADLTARLSAHAQILALLADRLDSYDTTDIADNASTSVRVAIAVHKAHAIESALMKTASTTELATASETPDNASTSTPVLALNTAAAAKVHVEEAHILRQELRLLNYLPKATTTASTTASSTAKTATSTASTTDNAGTTTPEIKMLEILKN